MYWGFVIIPGCSIELFRYLRLLRPLVLLSRQRPVETVLQAFEQSEKIQAPSEIRAARRTWVPSLCQRLVNGLGKTTTHRVYASNVLKADTVFVKAMLMDPRFKGMQWMRAWPTAEPVADKVLRAAQDELVEETVEFLLGTDELRLFHPSPVYGQSTLNPAWVLC